MGMFVEKGCWLGGGAFVFKLSGFICAPWRLLHKLIVAFFTVSLPFQPQARHSGMSVQQSFEIH